MNKEQQKQHLIDIMQKDEELGLYDIFNDEKRQGVKELIDKHKQEAALKEALLELRKTPMTFEPEQETLEKYSERFDNGESEIGNPDTWGKRVVDKHKQDDENYLDSFGVTKTQFEVYRNFNKQETLGLKVSEETVYYQVLIVNNKGEKLAFKQNDKWTINASTEEILDKIFKTI